LTEAAAASEKQLGEDALDRDRVFDRGADPWLPATRDAHHRYRPSVAFERAELADCNPTTGRRNPVIGTSET